MNVCWTMLLLNTAPQFVGSSNTLHKTNIVETESHYVVYMLGLPTCTLYTTKVLTEECCLTVLVYKLSVETLSCWFPCCTHLCWFRVLNPGMLQFHPRLLFLVSVSPIVGCCSSFHLLVLFHCSTMIAVELFHKAPAAVDILEDRNVASESFRSLRSPVGNLHSLLQRMLPFKDLTQMVLDLHGHVAASLEARVFEGVYQGCKPFMLRSSDLCDGNWHVVMPHVSLLPGCGLCDGLNHVAILCHCFNIPCLDGNDLILCEAHLLPRFYLQLTGHVVSTVKKVHRGLSHSLSLLCQVGVQAHQLHFVPTGAFKMKLR